MVRFWQALPRPLACPLSFVLKPSEGEQVARFSELVQHPAVLRAAWQRVQDWYSTSWAPQPEFQQWHLDSARLLAELGAELSTGRYVPSAFPLLPYPKKGGQLRHYCLPSVRDQVAFGVFGALLAPLLEGAMPNFSLGNRTFRRVYRDRHPEGGEHPKWRVLPFSLADSRLYQPYRRAHGLFRRIAHWTAAALTATKPNAGNATGRAVTPDDYPDTHHPPFMAPRYWGRSRDQAYWAQLDLQLAYPSVRLQYLEAQMHSMLSPQLQKDIQENTSWLTGFGPMSWEHALELFPEDVRDALLDAPTRAQLVTEFMRCLKGVRYVPTEPSDEAPWLLDPWKPPHADQDLPSGDGAQHPGLPTGLAISGILLNVYLHPLDRMLCERSAAKDAKTRFAMLRFADDLVLMSSSREGLADALDAAWSGLCGGTDTPVLAAQTYETVPSNLRVNWTKVQPEPLAHGLKQYLKDRGQWRECDGCQQPVPPEKPAGSPPSFGAWVRQELQRGKADWLRKLHAERLRPDTLGPFVTYLVERLSVLSTDGLQNRFGEDALQRLVELHELVRFDFDDLQVKEETRLSFAASQLSRAWLSEESLKEDRNQLEELRRSIQHAVQRAPWKFQLWRAAVRAAVRRPLGCSDAPSADEDRKLALAWLTALLRQLDGEGGNAERARACWDQWTPEQIQDRASLVVRQSQSFLRASFWRHLAEVLQQLARAVQEIGDESSTASRTWSSASWLFRALPQGEVQPALAWLGTLDVWASALYAQAEGTPLPWWETEALALAVLAATPRAELHQRWRVASPRQSQATQQWKDAHALQVPRELTVLANNPKASALVASRFGSAVPMGDWTSLRGLPTTLLGHVTASDESIFSDAFVKSLSARSDAPTSARAVRALRVLGLSGVLAPPAILKRFRRQAARLALRLPSMSTARSPRARLKAWLLLEDYHTLRQHVHAMPANSERGQPATLFQVLWGNHWSEAGVRLAPAEAPVLGLPLRIALRLLREALEQLRSEASSAEHSVTAAPAPVVWTLSESGKNVLFWGRRQQFDPTSAVEGPAGGLDAPWLTSPAETPVWEVLPHALYFCPAALAPWLGGHAYTLLCHALQFWTAADGAERLLDSLFECGLGPLEFEQRWDLRDRHHLPDDFWSDLEDIVRGALLYPLHFRIAAPQLAENLQTRITALLEPGVEPDDFRWERADVMLDERQGQEAPVFISSFVPGSAPPHAQVPKLRVRSGSLGERMTARLGQISASPDWQVFLQRFPRDIPRAERQAIMRQVKSAVRETGHCLPNGASQEAGPPTEPDIVVLPEAVLPPSERKQVQALVSAKRCAVLCGELFSELPTVFRWRSRRGGNTRWLVNEASLFFPVYKETDSGPPLVRRFAIRKPMLSHVERGLAEALSARDTPPQKWRMLAGKRWYRFVHEHWGDFTVAICSDLIDPSPWWSLRAQVLHIFMAAYNTDVELFDALTWIRAYENFCNVVSSNHGAYGGSVAWTPKHEHRRELARLRGSGLFLLADVHLPVKDLFEEQQHGAQRALQKATDEWQQKKVAKAPFKSPPPSYPGRKRKRV